MANEYGFSEVKPFDYKDNVFKLFARDWMIMTAEKDGKCNGMTVGWGGLGVMWGKNVAFVAVRPERYTYEFTEAADTFSLTVFDQSYRKMLGYFGTVSGRDEDKIAKSNLTVIYDGKTPYFQEAIVSINCKKILTTGFQPDDLVDPAFSKFYGGTNDHSGLGGGWHYLYIAEIEKILAK